MSPSDMTVSQLGEFGLIDALTEVLGTSELGPDSVVLVGPGDDAAVVQREVQAAVKAVHGSKSLLFINDHWQAAIDAGAYGVHLGQEDMQDAPLARIRASGLRLGLSSHGYVEMLRAALHEPSYIALGAVFPTTLKRMQTAPQGTGRLYAYAKLMQHSPLVAIGGIDEGSIRAVSKSGVGSVAVVRAITQAKDPKAAIKHLQELMQ